MLLAKKPSARRTGATAVEMAFVALVFILFLFGIVEYCLIIYSQNIVENAAREGARYAVVRTTDTNLVADTQAYVQTLMCGLDTKYTGYSCNVYQADSSGNDNGKGAINAQFGQYICVDVQLTYTPITPVLLHLSSFTIRSKCAMISEAN
ncbi:MAG TPA: TadE/TadG family type IV pilus assembly protein [Gemmataceae bacterium]|nr:TadE/TadG family type IV pilus assembly protein [Gemmataceae bacterium]